MTLKRPEPEPERQSTKTQRERERVGEPRKLVLVVALKERVFGSFIHLPLALSTFRSPRLSKRLSVLRKTLLFDLLMT